MTTTTVWRRGLVAAVLCVGLLPGCKKGKEDDSSKEKAKTTADEPAKQPGADDPDRAPEPPDEAKALPAEQEAEPVQAEGLPTGAEILDRFAEVTGGKAHEKIESRRAEGVMSFTAMGIEGKFTLYQQRPAKLYLHAELPGLGAVEQGFDGEVAWEKTQLMGTRILTDDERQQVVEQATFDAEGKWRDFYRDAVTVGLEEIGGKPAYKVVMTRKTGTRVTSWFDKESGLMLETKSRMKSAMGEVPTHSRILDYRDVDGLKTSFRQEVEMMNQTQVMTLEKVEHNVKIPADRFALPEDVAALAKASPQGGSK